jgi:hypothetical protein
VHGINWGARLGGGYYAYVTNQHANVMTVIAPDPDGDGAGSDAAAVGQILLANGSGDAGVTDGTGGQGVKPIPLTHDGWIQKTVAMSGTGALSEEVEGWIALLTDHQRNPEDEHPEPIPGDLNGDGFVGTADLLILLGVWGGSTVADLDADCIVGTGDLLILLANWT